MGYLDNSSITVDAVLTKKGREILKNSGTPDGTGGGLNISSFTLSDTGVDYSLWNPDHPSGSAFYGEAIENLPMLEASVHSEFNLRNRLITLNQKSVAVPALILSNLDSKNGTQLTFEEGDELVKGKISVEVVGYAESSTQQQMFSHEYYIVIQDPNIVSVDAELRGNLSGTSQIFVPEQDIPSAQEYGFNGNAFKLEPIQQDTKGKQTNIYIVHAVTGAYNSFTVVNNVLKSIKKIRSDR